MWPATIGISPKTTHAPSMDAMQWGMDYHPTRPPPGKITAECPWCTVSINFIGPFRRKRFVVSMIDVFSRYVILVQITDHTDPTVTRVVFEHLVAYFGVPAVIQ